MDQAPKKTVSPLRRAVMFVLKAVLTVGAFYLLLNHKVQDDHGGKVTILAAMQEHVSELDASVMVPMLAIAALIKLVGIVSSMTRWHLLLIGQGIRFNFSHVVGSFLIGRFLGTFLPSTIGLDSYKLYDAARFSGRTAEVTAATAVEKVLGQTGVFLCFLVTLPLGYTVFGSASTTVVTIVAPIATALTLLLLLLVLRPNLLARLVRLVPAFGRARVGSFVERMAVATTAYRGRTGLLTSVSVLSFLVHFCTAIMYFFTALAVGAHTADFWQVSLASTVQIFATVLSPFTIAGEGVREAVQALLLAKHIGASESVLSAALGFWAAEALTLFGGVFWWLRRGGYKPKRMELSAPVEASNAAPVAAALAQ